jgi:hypothetical protein
MDDSITATTEQGYDSLAGVLIDALHQAQYGKGHERHATDQPFIDQPIMIEARLVGLGFTAGQARKKILEAIRYAHTSPGRSITDLLGAIVYTAATVLAIRERSPAPPLPLEDVQPERDNSSTDVLTPAEWAELNRGSSAGNE